MVKIRHRSVRRMEGYGIEGVSRFGLQSKRKKIHLAYALTTLFSPGAAGVDFFRLSLGAAGVDFLGFRRP